VQQAALEMARRREGCVLRVYCRSSQRLLWIGMRQAPPAEVVAVSVALRGDGEGDSGAAGVA
jgi:hypothetical protein